MTPKEQLDDIRSRSNTMVNTSIRQVQGGFVVTGQVQFAEKETSGILASLNAEGIAGTPEQAAQMALNYMRTGGSFEQPTQQFDQNALGTAQQTGGNPQGFPATI